MTVAIASLVGGNILMHFTSRLQDCPGKAFLQVGQRCHTQVNNQLHLDIGIRVLHLTYVRYCVPKLHKGPLSKVS